MKKKQYISSHKNDLCALYNQYFLKWINAWTFIDLGHFPLDIYSVHLPQLINAQTFYITTLSVTVNNITVRTL